jgi:hypothetical protein
MSHEVISRSMFTSGLGRKHITVPIVYDNSIPVLRSTRSFILDKFHAHGGQTKILWSKDNISAICLYIFGQ